jgi:predicted RNA-binding Zn ribbon-like protein
MSQVKLDHDTATAVAAAVALVNSHDVAEGVDRLRGPDDLRQLVVAHGFRKRSPITPEVVERVREVRDALRAAFSLPEDDAVAALNAVVDGAGTRPQLVHHDDTGWHFHYTDDDTGWDATLAANLAMGLLTVIRDFGFHRLGTCASGTCEDVYVDLSRNASKRYCDPRTCGNKAAVQAYRARQAT